MIVMISGCNLTYQMENVLKLFMALINKSQIVIFLEHLSNEKWQEMYLEIN